MSDSQEPRMSDHSGEAPYVLPARPQPVAAPPRSGSGWRTFLVVILAGSIAFNILLILIVLTLGSLGAGGSSSHLSERFHSGTATARDKIAIVNIDGVLMDGTMGYAEKQVEAAASDEHVKAVVLRIVSPGGSITASDDFYRRIIELRDGTAPRQRGGKKPLVVSMGAMAASGGYYIAVPAQWLVAEVTSITGSIGVYAAFPNLKELGDKYGFKMNLIKAGDVKASGSMFHDMKPEERQLWQDMIDHAYDRFIEVVETNRPALKGKMKEVVIEKEIEDRDASGKPVLGPDGKPKMVPFVRRRADGGIFTAQDAKTFQLIDEIGYLDAAVAKAVKLAGLGEFRAITYDRPQSLSSMLFGQAPQTSNQLDTNKLPSVAVPRLWYLTSQAELSGLLSILRRD